MQREVTRGTAAAVASCALVVSAAGAALAAVGARQLSHREHRSSVNEQALAAGRQIAVDMAAYDYRHLEQDYKRVEREATGQFLKEFRSTAEGLQDLILKARAVATAEVESAAVLEATDVVATVLVAVKRTVENARTPAGGQTSYFGVRMTLRHVDGRWLASQVKSP